MSKFLFAPVALVMAVALAACGGNAPADNSAAPATTTTPAPATTTTPAPASPATTAAP
jgi:hypothetical protein